MDYRVLTVSREFGCGGGKIAAKIAEWLGWKLLDRELIEAIACAAHVDSRLVSHYDERLEPWLSRVNRNVVRAGAALAIGVVMEKDCFDANIMAELTSKVVAQAYAEGNCVIVGRGAQCILQSRPDAFHVFVYAPNGDRKHRLRARLDPPVKIDERIRAVDAERAHYLQTRFGKAWTDPHLYDLMIASREDENATARTILYAMTGQQQPFAKLS